MRCWETHYLASIDSNNKVIPWLNRYFRVFVGKYLKSKGLVSVSGAGRWRIRVQTRNESIESAEHYGSDRPFINYCYALLKIVPVPILNKNKQSGGALREGLPTDT